MHIRLRAFVPSLALATLAGAAVGLWGGMRFHTNLAHAMPQGMARQLQLTAPLPATPVATPATQEQDVIKYTCGMHPQIIRDGPGNCPICNMPLSPIHVHASDQFRIDPTMVQNMGVRTAMPILGHLQTTVRAVGTLTEPEQNHREINLRVSGWIEKLYADKDGMDVHPGDPLFDLYSPEITAAADELIAARKNADAAAAAAKPAAAAIAQASVDATADFLTKAAQSALTAARRKLSLLGLTDEQVAAIEKLDKAPATITITSPIHGHIAAKHIIQGSAVKPGDELMRIADRSSMWMIVQVFEQQLGQVAVGQLVDAQVEAFPGKDFAGKVDFVYPHLDPATRTAQVRVVLNNADHRLHENMFAEAQIIVPTDASAPGCVLIPREAVLDSGQRQVVFIAKGGGQFDLRPVVLGRTGKPMEAPVADDETASRYVEILSGLSADERVVTSGQFLLDSESRLEEARRKFEAPQPADNAPAPDTAPAGDNMNMTGGGM